MAVTAKAKARVRKTVPAAKAAKREELAKAAKNVEAAKAAKSVEPAKSATSATRKKQAQAERSKRSSKAVKAKKKVKSSRVTATHLDAPHIQKTEIAAETDPVWLQAEQDYANRGIAVDDIAKRLGLSRFQMNAEVAKRGWPLRSASRSKSNAAASETPKPTGLVRSVFKTIEGELRKLDSHDGTTSQDRERASRALSQMVNSLEKAVEMQSKIDKSNTKGRKAINKEHLAHADDLRRAIAERLERLNGKRHAGKPTATSD